MRSSSWVNTFVQFRYQAATKPVAQDCRTAPSRQ